MSEEHPAPLQESHVTWKRQTESISLEDVVYGTVYMGYRINVRGVHFRMGYVFEHVNFDGTIITALKYIIRFEPKVKDKNWQCPVKLHFAVYENIQNQCYYKRTVHVTFCSDGGTIFYHTHPKLTTNNLSEHFLNASFWSSIEIFVSPPSGLISCFPLNANLQFGVLGLAVNKELLAAHSDHFRKLFEKTPIGDYNTFEVDIDQSPGGIAHFKVLYDLLESDDTSQLNEQNIEGVLYLANKFQFHKAETACFTFINDKKNKLTLVEKLILYNLIGAEAAKRDAIKRATRREVANPTKFVRALYAAKQLSYEEIIDMEQIASETFPNM